MAFSYSGDPSSSSLDAVRFLIADTDANTALLQNSEIIYILTAYPNTTLAAAFAMEQIASSFSGRADIKVGNVSQKFGTVAQAYLDKAMQLRREATQNVRPIFTGGAARASFSVGLGDSPWAVQINSELREARFGSQG